MFADALTYLPETASMTFFVDANIIWVLYTPFGTASCVPFDVEMIILEGG